MSAAARGALVTCVVFAVTYLAGAFVEVCFDISQWHVETRAIIATMGCSLGLAFGLATFSIHAD